MSQTLKMSETGTEEVARPTVFSRLNAQPFKHLTRRKITRSFLNTLHGEKIPKALETHHHPFWNSFFCDDISLYGDEMSPIQPGFFYSISLCVDEMAPILPRSSPLHQ